jgi:acetyltransferase-like isoleucine patch superfamily enzyme
MKGYVGLAFRYCLASSLAKSCGENVYIADNVTVTNWDEFSIGNNVSIHKNCYLISDGGISIGDDVSIAHQSSLVSVDHSWSQSELPIKDCPPEFGEIEIIGDCWIGCGVRILKGVSLGRRCIVAAGSVVTKSVGENVIVAGVPAKTISSVK